MYTSLYAGSALQVVCCSMLLPVMTERVLGTWNGELCWLLAWQAHMHQVRFEQGLPQDGHAIAIYR